MERLQNAESAKELNITPVLDTTCKQNALLQMTEDNKKPQTNRQKEPGETNEEPSGCMRPEWINRWPSHMIDRR